MLWAIRCRKLHKPECPRPRTFFTLCSNLRGSHCRPPGPLPCCYCSTEEKTAILTYSKDLSLPLNSTQRVPNTLINVTVHTQFPKAGESTTASFTNSQSSWGTGWLVRHSVASSTVGHHLSFLWCSLGKPAPPPGHLQVSLPVKLSSFSL